MADIQPNKSGKKELTMEQRLLLAFVLMGLVLFLTPYFYKAPPPRAQDNGLGHRGPSESRCHNKGARASSFHSVNGCRMKPPQPSPFLDRSQAAPSSSSSSTPTSIPMTLSNRGGTVRSWILKKYRDKLGKPLELVNEASFAKVAPPFSIVLRDDKAADALNYGLYVAKPAANGLGIEYEFSERQELREEDVPVFKDRLPFADIETEVTINGVPTDHLIQWRGGFGDATVLNRISGTARGLFRPARSQHAGPQPGQALQQGRQVGKRRPGTHHRRLFVRRFGRPFLCRRISSQRQHASQSGSHQGRRSARARRQGRDARRAWKWAAIR